MKKAWNQIKKYPIMIVFFAFLAIFSLADALAPARQFSEFENRTLKQAPAFSWQALVANEWTAEVNDYVQDQFIFRDNWINTKSALELAQGKLENGGIWFADDGYLIAKSEPFLSTQKQRLLPINTDALCALAEKYPGQVDAMIVPSPSNIMGFRLRWNPPRLDENAYLDEMFTQIEAAGGNVIDLREVFVPRATEELYYRTDHHWKTDGGAWLAYEHYCQQLGLTPQTPPQELRVEVPGFYGTNYSASKKFGTPPETLVYYDFANEMVRYQYSLATGELEAQTGRIMNYEALDTYDKYAAFLHGNNNGYEEITGNGEGSVLVLKDSYGNSFVPYLVQNYAKVGVVDFRSLLADDYARILEEGEFDRILVLYSFNNFSEDVNANRMAQG